MMTTYKQSWSLCEAYIERKNLFKPIQFSHVFPFTYRDVENVEIKF